MHLGQFIYDLRKSYRLQQKELAERLGISPQYLSDIEAGNRQPDSDEFLNKVAEVFYVTRDLVYFAAGRLPPDIAALSPTETLVGAAFDEVRLILGISPKH